MHRTVRRAIVVGVIGIALFFGAKTLFRPRALDVELAPAAFGTVEDLVTNSEAGSIRSRAVARLGAERPGRVVGIPGREGSLARAGDVVLALDVSTAEARLAVARRDREAANATHQVTHANAELERSRHERIDALSRRGLASDEAVEEARARRLAADAELDAAEARLKSATSAERLARDELGHHVVRAPFDGVVTRRFVEVGESVASGQTVLEIADPARLYVTAPIDERDTGGLRQGQEVRVTVDAFPGRRWPGRLTRLASVVDETRDQNRTLEVEAEFLPAPGIESLRPGMTADLEIVLERREGVLRVPSAAVVDGERVWTVEGGRAATRRIVTGLRNWEWTQVVSGLTAGAPVITSLDRAGLSPRVRVRARSASKDTTLAGRGSP